MSKTQLTYVEKGKKKQVAMFRCMGDAREHLDKLEKALDIVSAELLETDRPISALARLSRSTE